MAFKRITTTLVIEIDEIDFSSEYESDPGQVLYWALEHGDAGGSFDSQYVPGTVKVEDIEENA